MVVPALTPFSTQVSLPASRLNKATCSSSSSPFSLANFHGPLLSASFFGERTSHSFRTLTLSRKRSISSSTLVLSILPTAKPVREPDAKIPKWSARSIKAFGMAELEARKLKYPNTRTEALVMGILVEGTSQAAKFLRKNGITLFNVREETVKILGKSDMYFFSTEHPPLTEPAQRALDWAVDEKIKSGDNGEISTTHMLL